MPDDIIPTPTIGRIVHLVGAEPGVESVPAIIYAVGNGRALSVRSLGARCAAYTDVPFEFDNDSGMFWRWPPIYKSGS